MSHGIPGRRHRWSRRASAAVALPLLVLAVAVPSAGAANLPQPPLRSGTATAAGSWAVLPMGQFSSETNTFWQVLHLAPGSSRWSSVTPEGTADNGGLVIGLSGSSVLAGVLPSQNLTFSPLSRSADSGRTWSPVFLPGAVTRGPDGLALDAGPSGKELAVVGGRVLVASAATPSWSTLVSLATLRRTFPRCGAERLEAAAFGSTGAPLVAVQCRHGVGVFSDASGTWRDPGPRLGGTSSAAPTSVVRLVSTSALTTLLLATVRAGRTDLVAAWQSAGGKWTTSRSLTVPAVGPVATSVGSSGQIAVLIGSSHGSVVDEVAPGTKWVGLPRPPHATVALAPAELTSATGRSQVEVFTVKGTQFSVYALSSSGAGWHEVQSTQVPLAYGSSS